MSPANKLLHRLPWAWLVPFRRPPKADDTGDDGPRRQAELCPEGALIETTQPEACKALAESGQQQLVCEDGAVADRTVLWIHEAGADVSDRLIALLG